MIYTVTLNPAVDYVMKLDGSLEKGNINKSTSEAVYYGGKGINVSAVLTRLGADNTALGFIAGFTGKELERLAEADGINCSFNTLAEGQTRINVKIKADGETDINAQGPEITDSDIEALIVKLPSLNDGDTLVLAGSIPKKLSSNIYERIIKSTAGKDISVIVDTTGDALLKTLKYRPFLIKPNHIELGEIFGVTLEDSDGIIEYAKKLQDMGARNVLVSRAEKGAILLDENGGVHRIKNAEGTLVNSVGCGDSMVAGFIAGYLESGDYENALKLATACANATAYSEGLAKKKDIMKLYNS